MSTGGNIIDAMITGRLKAALEAVEAVIASRRGRIAARSNIIKLRAAVLTSNRDRLIGPFLLLCITFRQHGVPISTLIDGCGRNMSWFQQHLTESKKGKLRITHAGTAFDLEMKFVPFYARLGHLMTDLIGFDPLSKRIAEAEAATSTTEFTEAERGLCRDIARTIAGDIPNKPDLRRYLAIQTYLAEAKPENFKRDEVSDPDVFGFWEQTAPEGGDLDVKRHQTCVAAFSRLLGLWAIGEASAKAAEAMEYGNTPHSAYADASASHQNADRPQSLYTDAHQQSALTQCALSTLSEAPEDSIEEFLAGIKASRLNIVVDVRADLLAELSAYASGAENLHRSRARVRVFDPGQTSIANFASKANSSEQIREHAARAPKENYPKIIASCQQALISIENALWGCAHLLAMNRRSECVEMMLELADQDLLSEMRQHMDGSTDASTLIDDMEDSIAAGEPVAALTPLLKRAASGFAKTEREGFFPHQLHDEQCVAAASDIADLPINALPRIRSRIARLETVIAPGGGQNPFNEDHEAFSQFLAVLYSTGERDA